MAYVSLLRTIKQEGRTPIEQISKKVISMTAWKTVHLILHIGLWDKQILKKNKTFALQSMSAYKLNCGADIHFISFQANLFSVITEYIFSN